MLIIQSNAPASISWEALPIGGFFRINSTEDYGFKLGDESLLLFNSGEPDEIPQVTSLSEYEESIAFAEDWMDEGFMELNPDQYDLVITL